MAENTDIVNPEAAREGQPELGFFARLKGHFLTVCTHRRLVRKNCFRVGLYWQGLTHDLSKFSPVEFGVGIRYFQGYRSPNAAERQLTGVSRAWLHHKGRNKHHYEYWTDVVPQPEGGFRYGGCRMPRRYIAEMFCDRVAASKVYKKDAYTDAAPYEFYDRSRGWMPVHPDTAALLESWLITLRDEGEEAAFARVRREWREEPPAAR